MVLYLILKYVNVWPKDKINWPKIKLTGPKIKLTGPKIKLTGPKIKLTGPKMYTVNGPDAKFYGCVGTVGAGCVGWYSRYWMSVIFECWPLGICWLFGCWFKVWSVVFI